MHYHQANAEKIAIGRKYYIFLKKKVVRVQVVNSFEDIFYKDRNGDSFLDLGVRVKRLDNGNHLPRPRRINELYTRNGT